MRARLFEKRGSWMRITIEPIHLGLVLHRQGMHEHAVHAHDCAQAAQNDPSCMSRGALCTKH